jgi:hypothetical protein
MDRATALAHAIRDAHPDDARQILTAALLDLSAGYPPCPAFANIREDARWWAGMATPTELLEYMGAALRVLGNRSLGLQQRKQLFGALWNSFGDSDRLAFIRRVSPSGEKRNGN